MTAGADYDKFSDDFRRLLRNRLSDDSQGRRMAMVCLDALAKAGKLTELKEPRG